MDNSILYAKNEKTALDFIRFCFGCTETEDNDHSLRRTTAPCACGESVAFVVYNTETGDNECVIIVCESCFYNVPYQQRLC